MIANESFTCKTLKEKTTNVSEERFFNQNNKCFEIFELEIYALNLYCQIRDLWLIFTHALSDCKQ